MWIMLTMERGNPTPIADGPFASEDEATAYAEENGIRYWLILPLEETH